MVFVLPNFSLFLANELLDFEKQAVLFLGVFLALFFWLIESILEQKIILKARIFNLLFLSFFFILAISTYFSLSPEGSFWGRSLPTASSFLASFLFLLFSFLVFNIFQKEEIFWLSFVFSLSCFFVILLSLFQVFNKIAFVSEIFPQINFEFIGPPKNLAIFVASLLPILISFFLISRRLIKLFFGIFLFLALILIFLLNVSLAWISILISALVFWLFLFLKRKTFSFFFLVFIVFLLTSSIVFGVLKIKVFNLNLPDELSLSFNHSFEVAKKSLVERGIKDIFFGSGPGTFVFNYSKFKPVVINLTNKWDLRFFHPSSFLIELLIEFGLLGFLIFLAILVFGLFSAIFYFFNPQKREKEEILAVGILASFLAILIVFVSHPGNLMIRFLFWFFLAIIVLLNDFKKEIFSFNPAKIFFLSLISFLVLILIFTGSISLYRRILAEKNYQEGKRALAGEDYQEAIEKLVLAKDLVKEKEDLYLRDLAQTYLLKGKEELEKGNLSQKEIENLITPLFRSANSFAKKAVELSPNNVANWAIRGFIYQSLINLAKGAEDFAIQNYQKASELEPTNPYFFTQIGAIFLVKNEIERARESLEKAVNLKPDFPPAHFQMAILFKKEGKVKEAIEKLEELKLIFPEDKNLAFQFGVFYYQEKQFEKAKAEFERAILIDPDYSNARYYLGLIYDKEGKKDLAIEQFERIEKFNPDHSLVKEILQRLREGKPAREEMPTQIPIEEKLPERIP